MSNDHFDDQTAYRTLKPDIDSRFPTGRFIAIRDGQVVADAASFAELGEAVSRSGFDLKNTLVVQAGVDYPEFATIFLA